MLFRSFPITLSQYAPALFSTSGNIVAATRVLAGTIVTAANPALPGDMLYLYATGLGAIDANGNTNPLPSVAVGGQLVTVLAAVAVSGSTGEYQVTIQLPVTAPSGSLAVVLLIDGSSPSQSLALPVGVLTSPVITDVENGASFASGIVPNAWLTIKGVNLSTVTDNWNNSVVNGVLPTTLDGVSVKVGGQPAYISYISPGQINAVAPNITAGSTSVTVTNSVGTNPAVNFTAQIFGPAFFQWGNYAVATRQDYSWAVKNGTFPGTTTVPAKPGDVLILWGTGFGPTNPPAPVGIAVPAGSYPAANNVTVTVGGVNATVYGTALASGSAALFQVAIQVPTTLADGDYPLVATVNGVSSPSTTLITVQH